MGEPKHFCWYRVSTQKHGRDFTVHVCVAWKVNPAMPQIEGPPSRRFFNTRDQLFSGLDAAYVARMLRTAEDISANAREHLRAEGLKALKVSIENQDAMVKYLNRPVPVLVEYNPYCNFFWLDTRVPLAKGQKALVARVSELFAGLSVHFQAQLDVELERP